MVRPDNATAYGELDLKLGIKSSLPNVRSTLGLVILLWEASGRPADIAYSDQQENKIVLSAALKDVVIDYVKEELETVHLSEEDFIQLVNENQLFKSQIEALIVAFELIWRLGKITFVDNTKPYSAERTGGIRYEKRLFYSSNLDVLHAIISNNTVEYKKVLLSWIGVRIPITDTTYDYNLICSLNALSENALYKLRNGVNDVIFNQNSIYKKLLSTDDDLDIDGDLEAKGSLRILKSALGDGLNPYLVYTGGVVSKNMSDEELTAYQSRVDTYLRLCATKVVGLDEEEDEEEETPVLTEPDNIPEGFLPGPALETSRKSDGQNVLLYGVPGSGKSWTIEHEYCSEESEVARLVFHPDYTNADFIGQILPVVDAEKQVTYEFTAGPFTTIIKDAYYHPSKEYILIIEEINRGNAPAIFGEVFQLLDRTVEPKVIEGVSYPKGTSEYGVTHKYMAEYIYGDAAHKIRIPSNLSIIGTMNTSDQNVFTLDTAFQRRWRMRLIENSFHNVRRSLREAKILDTEVTWKDFCEKINSIIIGNKAKMASAEDKRLGVYFVHESDITFDTRALPKPGFPTLTVEYDKLLKDELIGELTDEGRARLVEIREAVMHNRMFPEKVIKYLWDDAFKFNPEALFDMDLVESLEQVINVFVYSRGRERFKIFKGTVRSLLYPDAQA